MKKYVLLLFACMGINVSYAQLIGTGSSTQKKQSDLDWYNCSLIKMVCMVVR